MNTKLLQIRMFFGLALAMLGLSLVPVTAADSTFSDANWSSIGGFPGANGRVNAAVVDGAGNLYIGGDFTLVGDVIAIGIAKWDGNKWSALGTVELTYVFALAVIGSDLYAAGAITTAGGIAANIAKWDGTGWSALASGMEYDVSALAVSRGDLYIGGYFTNVGGITANYIAKWNGSSWSALGSGISGGTGPGVSALAVIGSDLYAGGYFTEAGGIAATSIAKWDGTNWSALGSGISTMGFALEQTSTLTAPGSWVANTAHVADDGTTKSVILPATSNAQFFRLRRP